MTSNPTGMDGMHGMDDSLTQRVIGLCFAIQNDLGHGFVESVYQRALGIALAEAGIPCQLEVPMPVAYRGHVVGDFRADAVVDGRLLLELKALKALAPEHIGQVLNYLKASRLPLALLINFGQPKVEIRRIKSPFSPPMHPIHPS